MTKPRAIEWLEAETGQSIDYRPEPQPRDRHISVRVTGDLASRLEALATERNQSVSQLVRDLVTDAVERRDAAVSLDTESLIGRLNADMAEVSRRLTR